MKEELEFEAVIKELDTFVQNLQMADERSKLVQLVLENKRLFFTEKDEKLDKENILQKFVLRIASLYLQLYIRRNKSDAVKAVFDRIEKIDKILHEWGLAPPPERHSF